MAELITHATCHCCGVTKPANELNGVDFLTGDTSHAYCRNLAECESAEAEAAIDWVLDALDDTETSHTATAHDEADTGNTVTAHDEADTGNTVTAHDVVDTETGFQYLEQRTELAITAFNNGELTATDVIDGMADCCQRVLFRLEPLPGTTGNLLCNEFQLFISSLHTYLAYSGQQVNSRAVITGLQQIRANLQAANTPTTSAVDASIARMRSWLRHLNRIQLQLHGAA